MAVTDYATLKTAVAAYLDRAGSSTFTDQVDTFIDLFEAVVNRECRHHEMESVETITTNSSGVGSLPSDYVSYKSAYWDGSIDYELEIGSKAQLTLLNPAKEGGTPQIMAIYGTSLEVSPIKAGDVVLSYYAKITPLSGSATTNWLMDIAPDAYLFGCLAQAHAFLEDEARAAAWDAKSRQVLEDVGAMGDLGRYGNAGIILSGATA